MNDLFRWELPESFDKSIFRKLANHATATRGAEMEALMAQEALLVEHQTDALSAVSGLSFRSAMDHHLTA